MMGLQLIALIGPFLRANSYLLIEDRHTILIDPFWNEQMQNTICMYADKVDYIFLTHEHYDHVSGVAELKRQYACPVVATAKCKQILNAPHERLWRLFEAFCRMQRHEDRPKQEIDLDYVCQVDEDFFMEKQLSWNTHMFYFRATPGHSPGSACILLDKKVLFSGDSLLPGQEKPSIFLGGSMDEYQKRTMPFFCSLPKDIVVYPGHFNKFYLGKHPAILNN